MMNVAPHPVPALSARIVPPMQLDQVPHDREAEAEAAVRARHAAVGLTEAIEDVRQELRGDADAGVGTRSRRAPSIRDEAISTRPPAGVNLTAFDSRFQMTCCRRSASPATASGVADRCAVLTRQRPSRPPPGCTASSAASMTAASDTSTGWRSVGACR